VAGLLNIVVSGDEEERYIDNVAEGYPGVETETGRWHDLGEILKMRIAEVESNLLRWVVPTTRPDGIRQTRGIRVRELIGDRMAHLNSDSLGDLVGRPYGLAGLVLVALDEWLKAGDYANWNEADVAVQIGKICAGILNWTLVGIGTLNTNRANDQLVLAGYNIGVMMGIATSTQATGGESSWRTWLVHNSGCGIDRMLILDRDMVFELIIWELVVDNPDWVEEDEESRWGGARMLGEAERLWEMAVEVARDNANTEDDDEEEDEPCNVNTDKAVWNSGMTRISLKMGAMNGCGEKMSPFGYEPIRPSGAMKYVWRSGGGLVEDEKLGEVYEVMRDVQGWRCGIGLCYYIDTEKRVAMIGADVLGLAFTVSTQKWVKVVSWTGRGMADRNEVRMVDSQYGDYKWLIEVVVPDRVWDAGVELWKKGIFLMSDLADVGWTEEAAKELWPDEVEQLERTLEDDLRFILRNDKVEVRGFGGWLNFQGAHSCLGSIRFSECGDRERRTAPMVRGYRALGVVQGDSHKEGIVDRWVDTVGMVKWLGMFIEKTRKWGRQETVSEMANWLLRVVPADGMDTEGNRWELWPTIWIDGAGRTGWIWRGRMVANPEGWMNKEDVNMVMAPVVWDSQVGWKEGWTGLSRCGGTIPGMEVSVLEALLTGKAGTEGYMISDSGTLVGGRSGESDGDLRYKWEGLKEWVGWKVYFASASGFRFTEMVRRLNGSEFKETDWTKMVNGMSTLSSYKVLSSYTVVVDKKAAERVAGMEQLISEIGRVDTKSYFAKGYGWESRNTDWGYLRVMPIKMSELIYAKGRIPVWSVNDEGELVNIGKDLTVEKKGEVE
jgi:hypothetical protein